VDPQDLTSSQFITCPAAWQACRSGVADPARFLVDPYLDVLWTKGWPWLRHNLVPDLAALAGQEMVLWDNWDFGQLDAEPGAEQLAVLDDVAAAISSRDVSPRPCRDVLPPRGPAGAASCQQLEPGMRGRASGERAGLTAVPPAWRPHRVGAGRSVLQSHKDEEDEHDQHDDAPQREPPDLAPHALDLPAAGPDAQAGLIGAGGMPHQQPGGDRDENGQDRKPIWGDWTGRV
jgi:hypothetical protein